MPEKPVDMDALLKQNPQMELNTRSGVNRMPPAPKTPEFKAWFKNSELVDANGNPMVFFHGSKRYFTEFGTPRDELFDNGLMFFAEDPEFAGNYAKGIGGHRDPNPDFKAYGEKIAKKEKSWDEVMIAKYGSLEAYKAERNA